MQRFVLPILCSFMICLLGTNALHAATIHVNNLTGQDSHAGLSAKQAVKTLRRAVGLLMTGDTLDIANTGKAYHEPLNLLGVLGTPQTPLVIEGHGAVLSGLVKLDPAKWSKQTDGNYTYPMNKVGSHVHRSLRLDGQVIEQASNAKTIPLGQCFWATDHVLFKPRDDKSPADLLLQATLIDSGVSIVDSSYITIRNLVSEYHANDGFNIHGNCRGIMLENIESRYNGDDGCSIHEDGQIVVRNGYFHHNTYGIEDVNAALSIYQHVLVENNRTGMHVSGGIHHITDSILRNNTDHQLRISSGYPAQYLGKDRTTFTYDGICFVKNVQLQGGKTGIFVLPKAKAFLNNCLIRGNQIGVLAFDGANLEMRSSIVMNNASYAMQLKKTNYRGDYNLFDSAKFAINDSRPQNLADCKTLTKTDEHSIASKPQFSPQSQTLQHQPFATDRITLGLTQDYAEVGFGPKNVNEQTATNVQKNDANALQRMIDHAIRSNQNKLTIPSGTYHVDKKLLIDQAKNLHIDAAGVKLIMTHWDAGLHVNKADGLTLSGFTVDYDPLPISQGVITAVNDDATSYELVMDEGYDTLENFGDTPHMHLFDPKTRLWKSGVWDLYAKEVKLLPGRKISVTLNDPEPNMVVGDLVAFDIRKRTAMNITRSLGENTFKDITFLSAPGLAICGRNCEAAQRFVNIKITRGPRPAGAKTDRLMSSSADGINFAYCRVGPIIENCDFSFMGDDSVNVHGAALPVMQTPDSRTFIIAKLYNNDVLAKIVQPGDPIRIMARDTFAIEQHAKVVKIEPLADDFMTMNIPQFKADFFPSTLRKSSVSYTLFRVTIDQEHHAKPEQNIVDFPTFNCAGYIVKNNYFHDHRGRGLRVMGNDGLIEGNTFERIAQTAISIGTEYGYWSEAGWVENITIRNNIIRDVNRGRNAANDGTMVLGAIGSFIHTNVKTPPFLGHRKIVIQNNTIDGSGTAGIHIYAADDVTITGNTIANTNYTKVKNVGQKWGLSVSGPIEVHGAKTKVIKDNIIK